MMPLRPLGFAARLAAAFYPCRLALEVNFTLGVCSVLGYYGVTVAVCVDRCLAHFRLYVVVALRLRLPSTVIEEHSRGDHDLRFSILGARVRAAGRHINELIVAVRFISRWAFSARPGPRRRSSTSFLLLVHLHRRCLTAERSLHCEVRRSKRVPLPKLRPDTV